MNFEFDHVALKAKRDEKAKEVDKLNAMVGPQKKGDE